MMLFLVIGIGITGWLGMVGLVRGELDVTYTTTVKGRPARVIGLICLASSIGVTTLLVLFLTARM